jgi:hypothetical protein
MSPISEFSIAALVGIRSHFSQGLSLVTAIDLGPTSPVLLALLAGQCPMLVDNAISGSFTQFVNVSLPDKSRPVSADCLPTNGGLFRETHCRVPAELN